MLFARRGKRNFHNEASLIALKNKQAKKSKQKKPHHTQYHGNKILCDSSRPHISLWKRTPVSHYSWKAAVTSAKFYVPIISAIV